VSSLAPRRPRVAAAGAVLAVAITAAVAAGAFTWLDQFAVTHLMPWLRPRRHPAVTFASLALPNVHGRPLAVAAQLWTYPASVVPSAMLVLLSVRRLPRSAAVRWCVLWVAANAIEVAGKATVHRPHLVKGHLHAVSFDQSLPSGHTLRSLLLAAVVAAGWRGGGAAWAWAAGVLFALVLIGAHTPSDVLAGIAVAVALAGWAPTCSGRDGCATTNGGGSRRTGWRGP
jgi:membrane-associated phospholipid phosphatase